MHGEYQHRLSSSFFVESLTSRIYTYSALRDSYSLMSSYEAFSIRPASSADSMLSLMVRRLGSMASTSISAADDHCHGAIDVVISAPVEKVWAIASDWLNFPRSVECFEGENGVPGCVRKVRSYNSDFWVAERLTRMDHNCRILSYDLVDGNIGIEVGYKAAIQVSSPVNSFHLESLKYY